MPRQKNRENAQCRTCGLFKIDNKTKDIKPDCYSCYKKNMIELDADSETVNCQKCQTVQISVRAAKTRPLCVECFKSNMALARENELIARCENAGPIEQVRVTKRPVYRPFRPVFED